MYIIKLNVILGILFSELILIFNCIRLFMKVYIKTNTRVNNANFYFNTNE